MKERKRTAIISGGAGLIGIEILKYLGEQKIQTAIFSSSVKKAKDTAKRLGEYGNECLLLECDVTDSAAVHDCIRKTYETFGSIDIMFCFQGWGPQKEELSELTDEVWDSVISTHLTGCYHMLKHAEKYLKESKAPRVVLLTSEGAVTGDPEDGFAYTAAKGGILAMTRYLGKRWKEQILINCIIPNGFANISGTDETELDRRQRDIIRRKIRFLLEENDDQTGQVVSMGSM